MNLMEFNILSQDYIKENGIPFEGDIWWEDDGLLYDKPESERGKPFSGLLYETYNDGAIAFYGYVTEYNSRFIF